LWIFDEEYFCDCCVTRIELLFDAFSKRLLMEICGVPWPFLNRNNLKFVKSTTPDKPQLTVFEQIKKLLI
jgi:hypothetical protein